MDYNSEKASKLFEGDQFERLDRAFARDGLSADSRMAAAIACLQAIGDKDSLIPIMKLAIDNRGDLARVYELLLQGYLFCGYPRAIESFFCLKEAVRVIDGLDPGQLPSAVFDDSDTLLERGTATASQVHGKNFEKIRNKISALSPDLGYLMVAEGYGHILSRSELDIKTRELAVVSSISAIGSNRQLNSHIRGCRNVGCEDVEIYEAIFTGSLWLPAEKIDISLGIWSDITGKSPYRSHADIIE